MASIFSLFGEIFIDNEKANKGMEETAKKGEATGDKIKAGFGKAIEVAAKVGTAVVGMASTVAGAAMKMANDTAAYADRVDKLSERTGINREELQRWMHAADQSGVSIDSIGKAIKKLSDVVVSAAAGNKSATESIQKLGLSLKDLEKMSPEQAFDKIAAALGDMEPGMERNKIGAQLFGKAYQDMMPLLNAGSEGMAALKKEADDLGLVMSEDAVKAGVVFGDTLANVKDAAKMLMNQLGSVAIQAVQPLLDMIIDHMPMIQDIFQQLLPVAAELFAAVLLPLMELAKDLFPVIVELISVLMPIIATLLKELLPPIKDLLLMLLPPIVEIVQKLLPPLLQLLEPVLQLLSPIIALLQPIIDLLMIILDPLVDLLNAILPPLINIVTKLIEIAIVPLQASLTVVANIIGSTVKAAFEWITNEVEVIKKIFWGLVDFLKNVFTGNWQGAWDAIKRIFSDIWEGIKTAFKIPINWIVDGINAFIRGINAIEIPDWVPGIGGAGFHINELPRLRIGMEYVPFDDFPALLHRGERVLTAREAEEYEEQKSVSGSVAKGGKTFSFQMIVQQFVNNSIMDLQEIFSLFMDWMQSEINKQEGAWA